MRACTFDGCDRKYDSNGLCKAHNKQLYDGKDLGPVNNVHRMSELERFISKIDKSGSCWIWTGYTVRGYGRFDINDRRKVYAHRHAYELWVEPITDGSVVHHKCAVRTCCNPEHLQLTTHSDNLAEMFSRRAYEARITELEARVEALELELLSHTQLGKIK